MTSSVTPVFTSTYSIGGASLLNLDEPGKEKAGEDFCRIVSNPLLSRCIGGYAFSIFLFVLHLRYPFYGFTQGLRGFNRALALTSHTSSWPIRSREA